MTDNAPQQFSLARFLGIPDSMLERVSDTWGRLIESETFTVSDALIADSLYRRQCLRRIRFVQEVRDALDNAGVSPRALPEGFILDALEGGSRADDPDVREWWCRLIVNTAMEGATAHPWVVATLRRLSGDDARTLRRIAQAPWPWGPGPMQVGDASDARTLRALMQLAACGLIEPPMDGFRRATLERAGPLFTFILPLGRWFLEAVGEATTTSAAASAS